MATEAVKITYVEAAAPSTPASGRTVVYAKADGLMYSKDDAGAETLMSGGASGAVATDAIWDAAGDLAVGSGANTAARLAKGIAGAGLGMANGVVVWTAGTSMPGTPATNDRYYRTDLDMEFFWDGTRWLSTQRFCHDLMVTEAAFVTGLSATASLIARSSVPLKAAFGIYLESFEGTLFVATTSSGTQYWDVALLRLAADTTATTVATISSINNTASNYTYETVAIGAVLDSGAHALNASATKVSTPGNLVMSSLHVWYRIVGT